MLLFEQLLCYQSHLWQYVHPLPYLNIHPPIRHGFLKQIVLTLHALGNTIEFEPNIFISFEGGVEVKDFDIYCHKSGIEKEFDC